MISYLTSSNAIAPITREVAELLGPNVFGGQALSLDVADEIVINPYHIVSRKNQIVSPLALRLRDLVFAALSGK